jgi:hypothetical protein
LQNLAASAIIKGWKKVSVFFAEYLGKYLALFRFTAATAAIKATFVNTTTWVV